MADAAVSAPPKQHPGERLATFFSNLFTTLIGISTLGASITFAKIVQSPIPPFYGPFSFHTTQAHLSISWLLFVLNLAITAFAACGLVLYRPRVVSDFGTQDSRDRRIVMWYASAVSALLFGILISAFVFLGLVVVSYGGAVGWAAVAITAVVGALGMGIIVWQSPIGSKAIGGEGSSTGRQSTRLDQYGSPPRMGSFKNGVIYEEGAVYDDGEAYDDGGRMSKSYGDVEQSSIARPMVAEVPSYLADMRRIRASRISGDSGYDGKY
ncbi:hypothetical protein G7Y89_g4266 [Cudoniella acicularis]|uniref:Uncharacterized protein n=1 Tax=Cudoniella acicularis TaxID=354080 RepID=A0A8H4RR39_9HELO|nr:hypothetical protein G7Y89_g4266 [Cudoniella acicularis]